MTQSELAKHVGHDVRIMDYEEGEPIAEKDTQADGGRFTLECVDCGEILEGNRVMVGCCNAISVTVT